MKPVRELGHGQLVQKRIEAQAKTGMPFVARSFLEEARLPSSLRLTVGSSDKLTAELY